MPKPIARVLLYTTLIATWVITSFVANAEKSPEGFLKTFLIFIFVPLTAVFAKFLLSRYQLICFTLFNIFWVWAAVNPLYPSGWLLENYLVFLFIPIILVVGIYFKLSDASYAFITAFMILHVIGSHSTYAQVPFGDTLQAWLGASRNMYDRLVHFSFGLLLAYPMRELFMRVGHAKGFWSYYLPVDIALAGSALYEIIEWLAALQVDPAAGIAFLGAQGDIWDAQKDMALAGSGAIIAMFITATIHSIREKEFWKEFRESVRPTK